MILKMIKEFKELNKRAIMSGLKIMIIIFSVITVIVCSMLFYNGLFPNLLICLLTILGVSFGVPFLFMTIAYLRWSWDIKVHRKNFNSFPFCDLENIGFRKVLLNQNSKWNFVKEIYRGEINGFIIDIDTDTQNEYKYLRFRFSLKPRQEDIGDFDFYTMSVDNSKFISGYSQILTKYHCEKNDLKSIQQLESELTDLTKSLNKRRN